MAGQRSSKLAVRRAQEEVARGGETQGERGCGSELWAGCGQLLVDVAPRVHKPKTRRAGWVWWDWWDWRARSRARSRASWGRVIEWDGEQQERSGNEQLYEYLGVSVIAFIAFDTPHVITRQEASYHGTGAQDIARCPGGAGVRPSVPVLFATKETELAAWLSSS
ncbi:hypothetical protein P154DRAFT_582156 [Amniculicola lignicola CBS 123094]|uniref:Uncharacterized protein n=1 Tax=Amniculicola lignicola CBS 123094 TaxID=1392246 RepID=A0A6A5VXD3_9PLEO|nr:hypothetical protein P154DRAFT_582156 [Amniculicola lignicola CBS 123094]